MKSPQGMKFLVFIEFHDGQLFKYQNTGFSDLLNDVWNEHTRRMEEAREADQEKFAMWNDLIEVKSFRIFPCDDLVELS